MPRSTALMERHEQPRHSDKRADSNHEVEESAEENARLPAASLVAHPRQERFQDIYELVTKKITAALEAGTVPWKKPWAAEGGLPKNLSSKRPYRGMNVFLLSLGQPYRSPWWLTFKQARELGGHVRKGEHSSLVTFWKLPEVQSEDNAGESEVESKDESGRRPPLLRYYHVFNVEQCEGIEPPPSNEFQPKEHERIARCEQLVERMPKKPAIGQDPRQAFYSPATDVIGMPDLTRFETAEDYYATLFHELVHSTGHSSRLARPVRGGFSFSGISDAKDPPGGLQEGF